MKSTLSKLIVGAAAVVAFGKERDVCRCDTLFARHLQHQQKIEWSLHEWQRCRDEKAIGDSLFFQRAAALLFSSGHYDGANRYLERLFERVPPGSSAECMLRLELARCAIGRGNYAAADFELNALDPAVCRSQRNESLYLKALVAAYTFRIDTARRLVDTLSECGFDTTTLAALRGLLTRYEEHDFIHPLIAHGLSRTLPGAGHWYAGKKARGIQAALLMSALSGAVVYTGYRAWESSGNRRFVFGMDAGLLIVAVWQRYWNGIKKGAYDAAVLSNATFQYEYREQLTRLRGF